MARVLITPRAVADIDALIDGLGLGPGARERIQRLLRILERFPRAGRAFDGDYEGTWFLIGPWPWMTLVYTFDEDDAAVSVVAVHDGRAAASAT